MVICFTCYFQGKKVKPDKIMQLYFQVWYCILQHSPFKKRGGGARLIYDNNTRLQTTYEVQWEYQCNLIY